MKHEQRKPTQIVASSLILVFCLMGGLALSAWGSPIVRANPGALFAKPDGHGSACTQASPCGLQTALSKARDGDAIYLAQGTYHGAGGAVITITRTIALYGGWDGAATGVPRRNAVAHRTTLDGESARRVAHISGPIAPTLDGLVIANGDAAGLGGYTTYDAGGGILVETANAIINQCAIVGNSAGSVPGNGTGGGIALIGSDARLENNLIISNTAEWGGGVRVISGASVFRHNRFSSNTSGYGGAMYLMWAQALVEGNQFQGNTGRYGGALYLSGANSTIVGNVIRDNQASFGAGIGINGGSPVVLSGNLILDNVADYAGGAVRISGNDAEMRNNIMAGNQAPEGAGIYFTQAAPVLEHNTFARNDGGDGVGVYVGPDATVSLTNTILAGQAVGITVTVGSTAKTWSTLWHDNASDWDGAGIIQRHSDRRGDPLFLRPEDGDYHIGAGSAAIDAGVDAGVATDIDGDPRPVGVAPDIGADEWRHGVYLPRVARSH